MSLCKCFKNILAESVLFFSVFFYHENNRDFSWIKSIFTRYGVSPTPSSVTFYSTISWFKQLFLLSGENMVSKSPCKRKTKQSQQTDKQSGTGSRWRTRGQFYLHTIYILFRLLCGSVKSWRLSKVNVAPTRGITTLHRLCSSAFQTWF